MIILENVLKDLSECNPNRLRNYIDSFYNIYSKISCLGISEQDCLTFKSYVALGEEYFIVNSHSTTLVNK
jgi:hypothetical protein